MHVVGGTGKSWCFLFLVFFVYTHMFCVFVCAFLYVWFCVCAFDNGLVDAFGGWNWYQLMFSVFSFLCVCTHVFCVCVCVFVCVVLCLCFWQKASGCMWWAELIRANVSVKPECKSQSRLLIRRPPSLTRASGYIWFGKLDQSHHLRIESIHTGPMLL